MPDITMPFWLALFAIPVLFQFGAGFTLIPRAPDRWRSFMLPSASIILAIPLSWVLFRVLLAPVMTWFFEGILLFLLVFALRSVLARVFVKTGVLPAGVNQASQDDESPVFDAFPWLAVWLSLSSSWSFLTALLAGLGFVSSLIAISFVTRLVEWRSELERKSRGMRGLVLRLIIALVLLFFFLLAAQLVFPREVLL